MSVWRSFCDWLQRHPEPPEPVKESLPDAKVGVKQDDGSVYAGISRDTGQPFYTTPTDVPLRESWYDAMNNASGIDFGGHRDWRVPTSDELDVLFNNRSKIGGFNSSGIYWTCETRHINRALAADFSYDGMQLRHYKDMDFSVRYVRG